MQKTGAEDGFLYQGPFPLLILALDTMKIPPNHPIILHPITQRPWRLIGDDPLHRPPRQGVIDDRAGNGAGSHVSDVFPAGGLVGATA